MFHLCNGGRQTEAKAWVTDLAWLMKRIQADPNPRNGCAMAAADAELAGEQLVKKLLRMSANAVVRDVRQLPGQAIGRLGLSDSAVAKSLLRQAQEWREPRGARVWLPLRPSLQQADGS